MWPDRSMIARTRNQLLKAVGGTRGTAIPVLSVGEWEWEGDDGSKEGLVGVGHGTLDKSEEVGMVRMAKFSTNEGVAKWVGNMDINEGGGGRGDRSGSSNMAERNREAPSRPRDRVSEALKVHFHEQTIFFRPNSDEKTFSLPLHRFFWGE